MDNESHGEQDSGTGNSENGKWKPGFLPILIGAVLVSLLYILLPNFRYLSDGLIAAIRMREASPWFIHPNHPIHPLVPLILYRVIGGESSGMDELELLLGWSLIAGLISCFMISMTMRTGGISTAAVLVGLGLFGLSAGPWFYFGTPNPSSTALAMQILALIAIALAAHQQPHRIRPGAIIWLGIFTSLAILAGQINAVLILPAAFVVMRDEPERMGKVRNLLGYLAVVAIACALLFGLGAAVFAGVRTPADFLQWQHSYVFDRRWWAHGLIDAVQRNLIGITEVHVASVFSPEGLFGNWLGDFGKPVWFVRLLIRIGQAIVLVFLLVETVRAVVNSIRNRGMTVLQAIGLVTALPIILFTCFWTPETTHYRILYVPGLLLFLVPSIEQRYSLDRFKFRQAWPVLLVIVCLFSNNLVTKFIPQNQFMNNPYNYEMTGLMVFVDEGDLVIYSGEKAGQFRALYAEYFLRCDTILSHELIRLVRECPEEVLENFREYHEAGALMLVHQDAIASEEDVQWMNEVYGMDIQPGELAGYIETWTDVGDSLLVINGKGYFPFAPKEFATAE